MLGGERRGDAACALAPPAAVAVIFDVVGEHRPGSHGASSILTGRPDSAQAMADVARRGPPRPTLHPSPGAGATLAACALDATSSSLGAAALAGSLVPAVRHERRAPRRILLLGGTGFIGPQLVHAALAGGHSVSMLNRGRRTPNQNAGDFARVEALRGDRSQPDAYASLAGKRWDVVVDTATNLQLDARSDRGAARRHGSLHVRVVDRGVPAVPDGGHPRGRAGAAHRHAAEGPAELRRVEGAEREPRARGFPEARSHHPAGLHRRPRRHLGSLHLLAGARSLAAARCWCRARKPIPCNTWTCAISPSGWCASWKATPRAPSTSSARRRSRPSRSSSTGSPRWPPRQSPSRGSRTTSGSRPTRSASPRRRTAPGSPMRFRG